MTTPEPTGQEHLEQSRTNFSLDPGAGRDCETGEDHVGAAPAAADAGPAQPQQGEARQGDHSLKGDSSL